MNRVAWFACALIGLARARFFERCELARDLLDLGVEPEHLATWVCIAYHESRFDTSANNPFSGDHGIFQISELYWCGPGKACGLPCSALRDNDISDDLQCALLVHEEHTRLQGNGFLAWVVYPQNCKHNTKKYLVDCDINLKNTVPVIRSRDYAYEERYLPNVNFSRNDVDDLLPPYLAIGNVFRGNYGKVLQNKAAVDWYSYKLNDVDNLKLPSGFFNPAAEISERPTTTTQATTTQYIPPVKPWRTIETNQFRKKKVISDQTTQLPVIQKESPTVQHTRGSVSYQATSTPTTVQEFSTTISTTQIPRISSSTSPSITLSTTPVVTSTTAKLSTSTTKTRSTRPSRQRPSVVSPTTKYIETTSTAKPTFNIRRRRPTTVTRTTVSSTTQKPIPTTTTKLTTTVSSTERPSSPLGTRSWMIRSTPPTTTVKSTTVTKVGSRRNTERVSTTRWTTIRPVTMKSTTRLISRRITGNSSKYVSSTTKMPHTRSTKANTTINGVNTDRPKNDFSWYTFTSRTSTTAVTKSQPASETTTTQPVTRSTVTTQQTVTQKPKATQSIFDLYLNPTKPPKLPELKHNSLPDSRYRIKIFAGGTTTPTPVRHRQREIKSRTEDAATRSLIRRRKNINYSH